MKTCILGVVALLAFGSARVLAQGTLSAQGYGYPLGGLSPRAAASGASLAEFDAQSAVNPASIGSAGGTSLFLVYQPEYRSVTVATGSDHQMLVRYPLIGATAQVHDKLTLGLSFSTFLDRTWTTNSVETRVVAGDTVTTTAAVASRGALNNVRFATSYRVNSALVVGAGLHAFTGLNRFNVRTGFVGLAYDSVAQSTALTLAGTGVSAGFEWEPGHAISIAGSARKGGEVRAETGDTVRGRGHIPNRVGLGLRYSGLAGMSLAATTSWEGWSSFQGMASSSGSTMTAFDTKSVSVGADMSGPRVHGSTPMIRGGVQWRTLPFGVLGTQVSELDVAGGLGLPLARGRAILDLSIMHAARSVPDNVVSAQERGILLGFGLSVRP